VYHHSAVEESFVGAVHAPLPCAVHQLVLQVQALVAGLLAAELHDFALSQAPATSRRL